MASLPNFSGFHVKFLPFAGAYIVKGSRGKGAGSRREWLVMAVSYQEFGNAD